MAGGVTTESVDRDGARPETRTDATAETRADARTDTRAEARPGARTDARAPALELGERGRTRGGETLVLNRRLFMQFLAFGDCRDAASAAAELAKRNIKAVLYEDLNDPTGIGLLTFDERPDYFLDTVRPMLASEPFARLAARPEYTMLGRTYSMGWESDLEEALITRPMRRVCSPELPWAVWYPLRRAGAFEELAEKDQQAVLVEHGSVGQSFGKAGAAHDIRLACHGLSREDNDFVIGLLGAELYPLSAVVQRMRKTRQTSRYLTHLGPFFVGRVLWRFDGA